MKGNSTSEKLPIVLVDPTSVQAFHIFNANEWNGVSKTLVGSCAAQHGLINYSTTKLKELFRISEDLCLPKINDLKAQWKKSNWPIDKCNYIAEIPEVHLFITVYLNSIKSFLDLVVQLISTEKIVYKKIHGFHKKRKDPGGEILHTLKNKAIKKKIAERLSTLITKHKRIWIDDVIEARDLLVHPQKGLLQVMFQLEITPKNTKEIKVIDIIKPSMNGMNFDQYAEQTLRHLTDFSILFVGAFKAHNKMIEADDYPHFT